MTVAVVMSLPRRDKSSARGGRGIRGLGSGSLLRSSEKNSFHLAEKLANLRARDDEGREKAQRKVVRAIDEQAAKQGLLNEGSAVDGQFDAKHQAFAADFADKRKFSGESGEAIAKLVATSANVLEKSLVVDDVEKFESRRASKRAAAKRRAVETGRNAVGNGLRGENRAERQSRRERLGDEDDVRLARILLISEIAASAPEAALNFIGDEERAVLGSQGAGSVPESLGNGINAAFALNRFEKYGANGVVEFRCEVVHVVEANEVDARNERSERQAIFFGRRGADSTVGAAVERIGHREDAVFARGNAWNVGIRAGIQAGEFQSAFDGLCAAIGEENAVKAGPFREFARERTLKSVMKEVGKVDRASGFAANDFDDARMRVAKSVNGDSAEKIEILFAARVEDVAAAAVGKDEGLALVGWEKKLFGVAHCGGGGPACPAFCGLSRRLHGGPGFGGSHHAAERAARAAEA